MNQTLTKRELLLEANTGFSDDTNEYRIKRNGTNKNTKILIHPVTMFTVTGATDTDPQVGTATPVKVRLLLEDGKTFDVLGTVYEGSADFSVEHVGAVPCQETELFLEYFVEYFVHRVLRKHDVRLSDWNALLD